MTQHLLNSILEKFGIDNKKCVYQSKFLTLNDFDKKILLPNSIAIITELSVFTREQKPDFEGTKPFYHIVSQGKEIDLLHLTKIKYIYDVPGNNIFTEISANCFVDVHTFFQIKTPVDNMPDQVYRGFLKYIEIEKT